MSFHEKATIMDAQRMRRALTRIALEIVEKNKGTEGLVLVGIQRRGVNLAAAMARAIAKNEGVEPLWTN